MSKPQTPGFHLNNFIVGSKFTRKLRDKTFPVICGSGGSKSRLAKAAVAEPAGQLRDDKLHAVVARSTFPSENVQNTWVSEHFWKLRCRKSARRCGAKHICKSKCTKRTGGHHFWELRGQKSVRRCGAKHISRISTQQVHCETICLVDGLSQQGHCKTIIFSHADFSGIQWPEHCKVSNPRP